MWESYKNQKASEKRAKEEAARQSLLAYKAVSGAETEQARALAAEQSRMAVSGMFGAPGTYELPGTAGAATTGLTPGAAGDVYQSDKYVDPSTKGLLRYKKYLPKEARRHIKDKDGTGEFGKMKGILDPEKFAAQTAQSADFRIRSRLTAESEQLLAQQGPAWDMLEQSTLGQIYEGAATAMRETMRDLKNRAAKGGTARRAALNEANQIRQTQDIAQMRINETWQANLKLHQYVRQNAEQVQAGNQRFLDNLPGIRDAYQTTMTSLNDALRHSTRWASQMSMAGYDARAAVGDSNFVEKLVMGGAALAGGALTGGMMGSLSAGQGLFGGLTSTAGLKGMVQGGAQQMGLDFGIPGAAGSQTTGAPQSLGNQAIQSGERLASQALKRI